MDDRPVMVITGTSRGIGRGLAEHYAARGYWVVGCSRGQTDLAVEGYDHYRLDVGEEGDVRQWVRSIRSKYGHIDALVCNAGLVGSVLQTALTSGEALQQFLRTNVQGTFYACREVSKAMIMQRRGRIVTFSSLSIPLHLEGSSAYTASKGAIVEMTKVLANELAGFSITCNVIAPALTMTDPARAMGEEWAQRLLARQTIQRTVTVEEICNVISFFIAPESSCITGQVIHMGLVS